MSNIRKYPRTRHILDSRLQPGDEDLAVAGFEEIAGRHLVIEEKVDGANAALGFDTDGRLRLQSRGHFLTGGPRERHFAPFKAWASGLGEALWQRLGPRFIVYGEWTYAKHTIYYDALPAYFLEFDVLDRDADCFLGTDARRRLLGGLPVASVPVLHQGACAGPGELTALVGRSRLKSPHWRQELAEAASRPPHRPHMVAQQTDPSDLMEGLYIKVEEQGTVAARYKYVRHDFLTRVLDSESHWQSRPILPNRLARRAAGHAGEGGPPEAPP